EYYLMRIIRKYFYLARILMRFLSNFLSALISLKIILLFFYLLGGVSDFTDTSMSLILHCNIIVDSFIFISSFFTILRIFRLKHHLPIKLFKISFVFLSLLLSPSFIFIENILLVFLAD
ncbi:MAG: hypothetical protein UHW86_10735, partial [Spirochaetota bacterium]|nr:hypothetical protein [Spirochaetota bacterium]